MLPRVCTIVVLLSAALAASGCGKPREPVPFRGSAGSNSSPPPNTTPANPAASNGTAKNETPPPATTPPAKENEASLRGYARNLAAAPVVAAKAIDDSQLNRAVQQFGAMEGRLPTSLQELVDMKYLPEIPKAPAGHRIDYDPKGGRVTIVRIAQ